MIACFVVSGNPPLFEIIVAHPLDVASKAVLPKGSSHLEGTTEIDVLSKEVLSENYTIVNSVLKGTSERPEVKIDWRIYTKNPDNPLIRDLIIEGLSLARTQKEEFNSVLEVEKIFVNKD